MGRTYKRNDLHNSRRPKSIREKRQFNGSKRQTNYDYDAQDFSTGKYNPPTRQYDNLAQEDYDAWMTLLPTLPVTSKAIGLKSFFQNNPKTIRTSTMMPPCPNSLTMLEETGHE